MWNISQLNNIKAYKTAQTAILYAFWLLIYGISIYILSYPATKRYWFIQLGQNYAYIFNVYIC